MVALPSYNVFRGCRRGRQVTKVDEDLVFADRDAFDDALNDLTFLLRVEAGPVLVQVLSLLNNFVPGEVFDPLQVGFGLEARDFIRKLPEKTGKSLEQWVSWIEKKGPKSIKDRRKWLKKEYGLATNMAGWLAERTDHTATWEEDPETYLQAATKYVEDMYSGAKAALRPIHDELIRLARSLGKDVKICPCKTIVPIYRKNVIAQIKPSTRTRIDFGLSLGDTKAKGRLVDTGGYAKKDRITHGISLTAVEEIDEKVTRWLTKAYERNSECGMAKWVARIRSQHDMLPESPS